MDNAIAVAFISASAAIVVPAITLALTKRKEREAEWREQKLEHYREFLTALSAITGTDSTTAGQRRFAQACNTLHLVASLDVINALHALQDEIRITNTSRSQERHDRLLSRLIWSIRADLGIPSPNDWQSLPVKLWTSGIPLDDPAA